MALTPQQCAHFETFGFLHLPGLLRDDIDWIIEEHAKVFRDRGMVPDGTRRFIIVPFIDQSERLCTLVEHPKVQEVLGSLIGEDFNYVSGDGNYYSGDTGWHPDGAHPIGTYVKFALYLDPLTKDTGCLRVIPGTHVLNDWRRKVAEIVGGENRIPGRDVPCVALETEPGDVAVFNHNLYHASFGGGPNRRMFDLNVCRRAKTPEEMVEFDAYLPVHCFPWGPRVHSDLMRETASPARMRHLEQPIEREFIVKAALDAQKA